jgi:hypothetical protein
MDDAWIIAREKLIRSKNLHWSRYTQPSPDWDHDHCEFCFRRFAEPSAGYNDSVETGYTTPDRFNWICRGCVEKYKDRFNWVVEPTDAVENS